MPPDNATGNAYKIIQRLPVERPPLMAMSPSAARARALSVVATVQPHAGVRELDARHVHGHVRRETKQESIDPRRVVDFRR